MNRMERLDFDFISATPFLVNILNAPCKTQGEAELAWQLAFNYMKYILEDD